MFRVMEGIIFLLLLTFFGFAFSAPVNFLSFSPSSSAEVNAPSAPTDEIKSCTIPQEDPEPLQDRASLANMTLIAMSGNMKLHPHWCPYKLKNVFQYIAYEAATVLAGDDEEGFEGWELMETRQTYAACLSVLTEEKCREKGNLLENQGAMGCNWCAIENTEFHSKLGKGTCLVKPLFERCATHQRTVYPYIMDLIKTVSLPSNEELGTCLPYFDAVDCKQAKRKINGKEISCAPCYAQPVFHLITNVVCFPESFAELGCKMLNEGIPDKVVTKFAQEGELRSCAHGTQEVLSNGLSSFGQLTITAVEEAGVDGPVGWCPSVLRNIVQFMVLGLGSKIKGNFNNGTEGMIGHTSCQQYPSKDQCEANVAKFGGMKCRWCPVKNSAYHKRLGTGSCLMEIMADFCDVSNNDVFPRLVKFDESINIPDGPAQAACLFHSHDKKKCETGNHATFDKKREFECKHIEIPLVYNLIPSRLCIQKDIADLLLEQLEDVPDKVAVKFNKLFKTTTTTTKTTTKKSTTTKGTTKFSSITTSSLTSSRNPSTKKQAASMSQELKEALGSFQYMYIFIIYIYVSF